MLDQKQVAVEKISDKLLNWASILEDGTRRQAEMTASMPFIDPHLALMPDAHLGKGATVGSVIPTVGAIIPAAVGVDIGCGMIAVKTQFEADQFTSNLQSLRQSIERAIPLSAGNYNKKLTDTAKRRVAELEGEAKKAGFDPANYAGNWQLQLGTLGSGNHFIEVTADETDVVWLFLHSGSRGVGNKIAMRHIAVAQQQMQKNSVVVPDRDLAYLTEGTAQFDKYIAELRWAQNFALKNREEMMDRLVDCTSAYVGEAVRQEERINCHHNFTQQEKHAGKKVWVSRKGAIEAKPGQLGLIPGSMGTASYVVEGKGNPLSLNSSPHGAGRNFSRSAARKRFTIEDLRKSMKGIEYRDSPAFLDEIPAAYKDIDQVMRDADDLVAIRHTLRQLVNVKGD